MQRRGLPLADCEVPGALGVETDAFALGLVQERQPDLLAFERLPHGLAGGPVPQ